MHKFVLLVEQGIKDYLNDELRFLLQKMVFFQKSTFDKLESALQKLQFFGHMVFWNKTFKDFSVHVPM